MAANVGKTDVTSVAVGSSSTNWGAGGNKAKAVGKTPRPSKVAQGQGGASRKLPSGTYKSD